MRGLEEAKKKRGTRRVKNQEGGEKQEYEKKREREERGERWICI